MVCGVGITGAKEAFGTRAGIFVEKPLIFNNMKRIKNAFKRIPIRIQAEAVNGEENFFQEMAGAGSDPTIQEIQRLRECSSMSRNVSLSREREISDFCISSAA